MQNPIQIKELMEFQNSLKVGDKLIYMEAPRDDRPKGGRITKKVMEVEKVHRYTVDLKLGKLKRNVTIKEALIWNRKHPVAVLNPEATQEASRLVMELAGRGMSRKDIAKETGYSRKGISNILRALKEV